ncbi:hypothetical protein [Litoribacter populi]|uniref:hypothetical protein n=1 Tax=Litoribacter populi TaxID=2598460 RepID=UPI001180F78B|nr:hypothetical protein [Litoribacter populi]
MGILGLAITGFLGFFIVRTIIPTYFMKEKGNLHLRFNKSKTNLIHFIIPSYIQDQSEQKFGWLTLDKDCNLVAIKEHEGFDQASGAMVEKTLAEFKEDLNKANMVISFDSNTILKEFSIAETVASEDVVCLKVLAAEFTRKAGLESEGFGLKETLENLFGTDAKDFDVSDLGINLLLQAKVVQKFGEMEMIPVKTPILIS